MQYRNLGNSDLSVSRIGFGCWELGDQLYGHTVVDEAVSAIYKALDLGVTLFDTAPMYGQGRSETLLGKALRACSINKQSAQAIGVNTHGMGVLSYMIGGALGAVAGIVIAPLTLVSYDMGVSLGLKGFIAAIMGGMISPVGAVIGGVLLGLIESLSSAVFSSGVKEGIAYAVLFAVLVGRTIWRAGHGRRDA